MGQRGGEWPRSADTRTVIRQIQYHNTIPQYNTIQYHNTILQYNTTIQYNTTPQYNTTIQHHNTIQQYNTRTVIRQIQATLPTKKSGLSRRIFRRKSFGSRSTVCLKERRSFFPLHVLGLINVGQICYNLLQTSVTVNERSGKVMFAMESLAANWGQPRLLKNSKACLGAPPTGGKTQC